MLRSLSRPAPPTYYLDFIDSYVLSVKCVKKWCDVMMFSVWSCSGAKPRGTRERQFSPSPQGQDCEFDTSLWATYWDPVSKTATQPGSGGTLIPEAGGSLCLRGYRSTEQARATQSKPDWKDQLTNQNQTWDKGCEGRRNEFTVILH